MPEREETLRTVLAEKLQEGRSYATLALTGFAIYGAINGALLGASTAWGGER